MHCCRPGGEAGEDERELGQLVYLIGRVEKVNN